MDAMYSVGTNNRFAFFIDNEDDPGDAMPAATTKKEESTKSAKTKGISKQQGTKGGKGKENKDKALQQANKKATENGTKPSDRPQSSSKGQPRSGGRTDRDRADNRDRGDNRRVREDRDDRPPRGPRRPRLSSKEKDQDNEGGFGGDQGDRGGPRSPRGRGPRPFRGGRGGGSTGFRGGKREFERRSGNDKSSVKPVDKREGGGAHNWGRQEDSQNDEWPSDEVEQTQEAEPVQNGETPEEAKTDDKGDEGESSPVEEGPQEMTLEEYRAKNNPMTVKSELQERKAGENVDDTQWQDTFQLEKADEEFFSGTREVIEKPKTSGRIRTTIDTTGFFFKDQARRGRGRTPGGPSAGGRGGRRSGEGRRGDFEGGSSEDRRPGRGDDRRSGRGDDRRSGRNDDGGRGGGRRSFGRRRDYAPNVEDEKDFPQLGAP